MQTTPEKQRDETREGCKYQANNLDTGKVEHPDPPLVGMDEGDQGGCYQPDSKQGQHSTADPYLHSSLYFSGIVFGKCSTRRGYHEPYGSLWSSAAPGVPVGFTGQSVIFTSQAQMTWRVKVWWDPRFWLKTLL